MESALSNLLYDRPELYDQVYQETGFAAARLCERFFTPATSTLLDVGCGTGRDLEYFAGLGLRCTGVDLRPHAIDYARRHRPGSDYHVADMRHLRLGRTFDVITCLGWVMANLHTIDDLNQAMAAFAAHAHPGTLLILHLPNMIGRPDGRHFPHRFEVDTPHFKATAEATYTADHRHHLLTRRRTWTIRGLPDQHDYVRFRMLYPMEIEHYLTSHGFTVHAMYDNTDAAPSDLTGGPMLYVVAHRQTAPLQATL